MDEGDRFDRRGSRRLLAGGWRLCGDLEGDLEGEGEGARSCWKGKGEAGAIHRRAMAAAEVGWVLGGAGRRQ